MGGGRTKVWQNSILWWRCWTFAQAALRGYVMVVILWWYHYSSPIFKSLYRPNLVRMNHIVFREDPKSHLPVSRTCTFFQIYHYSQWEKWHFREKVHFLQRWAFLLLHINSRGITLHFGIVKFGGCNTPTFQQACRCRCRPVKMTISMLFFSGLCQKTLFYHFLSH